MTVQEKAIINLQKGIQKITVFAAMFAERVRVELHIVRLRIGINEARNRLAESHRSIGRKVVDLHKRAELPKTTEQLMKDGEIVSALAEIADREKELLDLNNEILNEQEMFKALPGKKEDGLA